MTLLPGTDRIETDRLVLRRIEPDDFAFFAAIHADPDVARYIAHGRPRTLAETQAWLDGVLAGYHNWNLGQLAVTDRADGRLIGRCGLSDAALETQPDPGRVRRGWFFRTQVPPGTSVQLVPELGYTFARDQWGRGYASEAVGAVFAYARDVLRVPVMMSVIHHDNVASIRVAQKFAVRPAGPVELSGQVFDRYDWPLGAAPA